VLESLEELVVEVCQPKFAVLSRSGAGHTLNDLPNLLEVGLPGVPVVEQVDVHKFIDLCDHIIMNFIEHAIFSN
jgi:hypothetical protein